MSEPHLFGDSVAARRVARYGSGYHTITSSPQEVAQELQIVGRALEARGRNLSEIEVSYGKARWQGGTDQRWRPETKRGRGASTSPSTRSHWDRDGTLSEPDSSGVKTN